MYLVAHTVNIGGGNVVRNETSGLANAKLQ
jgi:hypothetical protein